MPYAYDYVQASKALRYNRFFVYKQEIKSVDPSYRWRELRSLSKFL
jgi:hypothetical protein